MRFLVYGAGAIGGVVAGRLLEHGFEVAVIARGPHGDAIATRGLRVDSPARSLTVRPSVVAAEPALVDWARYDAVLLAVKSQDTVSAVSELARWAPPSIPVACLQNGVANERTVLRFFPNVYGVVVMCPASHLEPGVVVAHSDPVAALLDVGRYPEGADDTAAAMSEAWNCAGMDSLVRSDIMRFKYSKLILMNLANAVDALCGPDARGGALTRLIHDEGVAVLEAAGIDWASAEEDRQRRGSLLQVKPIPGRPRGGSSSWQSLARSSGSIETDYLNGEIVLLGRLHGVATPANELVQRLATVAAREGRPPGQLSEQSILGELGA